MKLFIQVPCYNEQNSLPKVLSDLPTGFRAYQKFTLHDDGSTDNTVEVAKNNGVDFIVKLPQNRGLAKSFAVGLEYCFRLGADIVVNTDGDNQYPGNKINELVSPILKNKADMVIGARDIDNIKEFSFLKKRLQKFGSAVVSLSAGIKVEDSTSGFRAFNKRVGTSFSLTVPLPTLETVIQAARKNFK